MEIKLMIKYFWSVVYIVHSYNLHNMRYRQKCTLKKCYSHFPNLIKFWLNKGVNYTQDSMVLTLTNNKKNLLFWKKRSPCGRPDFKFLIAHIKFYSHWWAGKWISTTLLISAGFIEAEKFWLKFLPNLRK